MSSHMNLILCQAFCREALSWRQLRHPHIVPFLGLDADSHAPYLCMVSPCMVGGNVLQYVKNHKPNVDVIGLVGIFLVLSNTGLNYAHKLLDIIRGIRYLHSEGFVHGDLRAVCVYLSALIVFTDLNRPTYWWIAMAMLALRTLVSFLSSKHLTSQPMAVAIPNGWRRSSSIRTWSSSGLWLLTYTLSVAFVSRYDCYEYLTYASHLRPLLAANLRATIPQNSYR
jgi:serine/threonine protein kinase